MRYLILAMAIAYTGVSFAERKAQPLFVAREPDDLKIVISIDDKGNITWPKGLTPNEASLEFAKWFAIHYPNIIRPSDCYNPGRYVCLKIINRYDNYERDECWHEYQNTSLTFDFFEENPDPQDYTKKIMDGTTTK